MSIRFILQFNERPSHALIVCEPWTRWLVETESPSGGGHVIGEEIALRKITNSIGIITAIEVQLLVDDATAAQRYLQASAWWLHRAPFGVERLPVKLIVDIYDGQVPHIAECSVTSLQLRSKYLRGVTPRVDVRVFRSFLRTLEELDICRTPHTWKWAYNFPRLVSGDLLAKCPRLRRLSLRSARIDSLTEVPFSCLESLDLCYCDRIVDFAPLRQGQCLTELALSRTTISSISVLTHCTALRTLCLSECHNVSNLAPLSALRDLRTLDLSRCRKVKVLNALATLPLNALDIHFTDVLSISPLSTIVTLRTLTMTSCSEVTDWTPLASLRNLENLDVSYCQVTDLSPLSTVHALRTLNMAHCTQVTDVAPLAACTSLEVLIMDAVPVSDLSPLASVRTLRRLSIATCGNVADLSCLAGAPYLTEVDARESGVANLTGLGQCPNLVKLDLNSCEFLHDLSPLAGAPSLTTVNARFSAVSNIDGLETCPRLVELILNCCPANAMHRQLSRFMWHLIFSFYGFIHRHVICSPLFSAQ